VIGRSDTGCGSATANLGLSLVKGILALQLQDPRPRDGTRAGGGYKWANPHS
jgi:hypothetical protein